MNTELRIPSSYDNLKEWFEDLVIKQKDQYGYTHNHFNPMAITISDEKIVMQFCGVELVLHPDGTFILTDTTGG